MTIFKDNSLEQNLTSSIPSATDTDLKAPIIPAVLSPSAQLKLEVIESLMAAEDKGVYAARLKEAAIRATAHVS